MAVGVFVDEAIEQNSQPIDLVLAHRRGSVSKRSVLASKSSSNSLELSFSPSFSAMTGSSSSFEALRRQTREGQVETLNRQVCKLKGKEIVVQSAQFADLFASRRKALTCASVRSSAIATGISSAPTFSRP